MFTKLSNQSRLNSKWVTLLEMIIVIGIIIGLIAWIATSLMGTTEKQKDAGRIKLLEEYLTYYASIKQSIGTYPGPNVKGQGITKDKARALAGTQAGQNAYAVQYTFTTLDGQGFYEQDQTSGGGDNLKKLQEVLVETKSIGGPGDIKAGFQDENFIIFTSKSHKRAVGCIKTYAPTEPGGSDGDGIPDDKTADSPEASHNGNRIFIYGDKGLFKENFEAFKTACQALVDPAQL